MTAPLYHYGRATRKATYQLLDLFNEIEIKRYDNSGNVTLTVPVPINFYPADRLFWEIYNMVEPAETLTNPLHPTLGLPRLGLAFDGYEYEPGRMQGTLPHYTALYFANTSASPATWHKTYFPVPAKFNYKLSVATKYIDDMLQLTEQLFVLFYPSLWIDMHVDAQGLAPVMSKWDVKLTAMGRTTSETAHSNDAHFFKTDIDFSVHGWVFRYESSGAKPIHRVCASFFPTSGYYNSATSSYYTSGDKYDGMEISAVPSAISAYDTSGLPVPSSGLPDEDFYVHIHSYTPTGVV